jgi:hypothetical protein
LAISLKAAPFDGVARRVLVQQSFGDPSGLDDGIELTLFLHA